MSRTFTIGKYADGLCAFVIIGHKKVIETLVTESLEEPFTARLRV